MLRVGELPDMGGGGVHAMSGFCSLGFFNSFFKPLNPKPFSCSDFRFTRALNYAGPEALPASICESPTGLGV